MRADTLLANLTVYEMLLYTAEMRNKVSLPAAAKKDRVEAVLSALALQSCRDVLIGDPLHRGISGITSRSAAWMMPSSCMLVATLQLGRWRLWACVRLTAQPKAEVCSVLLSP